MGFTNSQQFGFDAYRQGKDIFIHGDSGTGKSYLVEAIVADATQKGKNVCVMAPTGKAARNVNGITLHSAFRISPGIVPQETIYKGKIDKNDGSYVIDHADIFIIDEISMVRYDMFDAVMRSIKASAERSTHKQIIVVGDFFQLPPVLDEEKDGDAYKTLYGEHLYAFESERFRFTPVHLTEVVRQKDDRKFLDILNRMRVGDTSVLDRIPVSKPSKSAVTLCARNAQAKAINERMLKSISRGKRAINYEAVSSGELREDDKFAPEHLTLVPGTHVLMTVNDPDKRWINGSDAIIVSCREESVTISVDGIQTDCECVTQKVMKSEITMNKDEKGKEKLSIKQVEVGSYTQLPMKLGWAITIHKSQGMTLNEVNIDPSGCFTHGQLYVAVSRCRTLKGIHMTQRPLPEHLICDQRIKTFMESLDGLDGNEKPIPEPMVSESLVNENATSVIPVPSELPSEPKKPKTIDEIIMAVVDFTKTLLRNNGYSEDTLSIIRPNISEKKEKSEVWKKAKEQRTERLHRDLSSVEDFEARKRLAISSNNAQSIYHVLRDNANREGKASITVDAMAGMVGLSPRSVGSALSELRESGLIASTGSKKLPEITIASSLDSAIEYSSCLLFQSIKTKSGKKKMQLVCSQCELSCPAHP